MKNTLLCILFFISPLSWAGVIEPAEITGQPFVLFADDGSINLCGLRLIIISEISSKNGKPSALTYDGSMSINMQGGVVIKGLAYQLSYSKSGDHKINNLALKSYWIKSEGGNATVPYLGKTILGDDKVSIMYVDNNGLDKYAQMSKSIDEKRPVMIGAKLKTEDNVRIFSGVITLSEKDLDSFAKCNIELIGTIRKYLDKQ